MDSTQTRQAALSKGDIDLTTQPDSPEAVEDAMTAAIAMGRAAIDLVGDLMITLASLNPEAMKRFADHEIEKAETELAGSWPTNPSRADLIAHATLHVRLETLQRVFSVA